MLFKKLWRSAASLIVAAPRLQTAVDALQEPGRPRIARASQRLMAGQLDQSRPICSLQFAAACQMRQHGLQLAQGSVRIVTRQCHPCKAGRRIVLQRMANLERPPPRPLAGLTRRSVVP